MLQLQFLFELPARLNKCIEMEAYSQAVRYVLDLKTLILHTGYSMLNVNLLNYSKILNEIISVCILL